MVHAALRHEVIACIGAVAHLYELYNAVRFALDGDIDKDRSGAENFEFWTVFYYPLDCVMRQRERGEWRSFDADVVRCATI